MRKKFIKNTKEAFSLGKTNYNITITYLYNLNVY